MKKSRFAESQIVAMLKEGEAGLPVADLCRKHGVSSATYYKWKSKYSGVQVSELHRLREPAAPADVRRSSLGAHSNQGCAEPKILTPSARREVVEELVQARLSITRDCQITGLSRAAYYKIQKANTSIRA